MLPFSARRRSEQPWRSLLKGPMEIGVNKIDLVRSFCARERQKTAIEFAENRAATKRVSEFFLERQKQMAIVRGGQVRDVDFDPCPFEQWQGIAPFA